jgi:RecA-family ATPase
VLLPLKDLLERPDELTQYLVDGLLPAGGTSIVAAKPKCGKTTLLRQLSLCVARGEMFLNRVCSKGPVIYFSVEEKIDEIKAHFKAMGANGSEEIYIFANRAPQDTIGKLKPIIEKIKPSLIILDTLFKIVRMKDANDYAAISTALEPIQDLARQSGSHVLCVHHAGKSDRDGADGILGSTAILGAFDTAIIMNRNNEKRTIKSIQRYGTDLEESALLFDLPTRRSSLGQENWKVKSDERADSILSFIRQAGQKVTVQEIKMATGMDKEVLLRTLKNMSNQKLVYSFGKGIKGDPLTFSSSI